MKAALVYTSTTPELIELVEREVRSRIGREAEIISLQDPSILAEVRCAGYVTPQAAAKLMHMYTQAVQQGADAILNICSSVGEAADAFQTAASYIGGPVVRIDEEMCREAVRKGHRIGVLATLPTTLSPTKGTIARVAREMGTHVELTDGLVDAFNLDQSQFRSLLIDAAGKISDSVDVIVLAQGSMAYVEADIEKATGKPVLSSPRFGAQALADALRKKGLLP
ncbi:MAG: Asp/Glu/hydantoin racemase [Clostridia bacterium]|nr:Asp/Glu/hydantoin racemase [Clostridia bacterium]